MKAITLFKRALLVAVLLLTTGTGVWAQPPCNTYVKQEDNIGTIEPRTFKDAAGANYFVTASDNNSIYISGMDPAGNILWTHNIVIPGDAAVITDMIVDNLDGTLVAVARGNNFNYIFKYDYTAAAFNWIKQYPNNYIFQNIHQMNASRYVVTGEVLLGRITIFQIDRPTGIMVTYQNQAWAGEGFSTYDGNDIYGACRYYSSGSLFNPSLWRFNAPLGTNTWTNTYVVNPPTITARIYPVAPITDGNDVIQFSSGDDVGFNTYQTGPTDLYLLKTDKNGNLLWTNKITLPGYKQLNAKKIINTATGYYLLVDNFNGAIVDYFFVIKTDKNGKIQWANRYGIANENSVVSGVEDAGYLYLSATSGSYAPGSNMLLLKLDPNGMSDVNCRYIIKTQYTNNPYNNTQVAKPTPTNPTAYTNANAPSNINFTMPIENIYCNTTCQTLPCNTLTGSLATGVIAFYPFGYGSLADLSGNGYNLANPTTAYPTMDRSSNPTCAYHFNKINGDFLTMAGSSSFLNGITTGAFSISLWYQPTGTRPVGDYELLIGRDNTGLHCPDTWGQWSVGLYDCRKAVVGFDQWSHWESPIAPNCSALLAAISNNWHHLAFVYDGGTNYDLYIDGVLYSNSHGPCGPMSANIGAMLLGADYTGDLDDIVIYNRNISSAEVFALMALNGSCCDGITSSNKTTGISTHTTSYKGITVYPNPADGQVSVSAGKQTIHSVSIYSNTGALQGTYQFNKSNVSVDIEHLAPGIYFLKVVTDAGSTTEKLIKN